MSDNKEIKYPLKSKKYKGVFQRKDGSWFYRIKKILAEGEEPWVYQKSGFKSEERAFQARQTMLRLKQHITPYRVYETEHQPVLFSEVFNSFLETCKSETSIKKYKDLYNSQLNMWTDRDIHSISESEIDVLLLKLALHKQNNGKPYSPNYQASVRKLIKLIFKYADKSVPSISGDIAQDLSKKPYKLRVLSLFSGIGAPEQALKNLDIDYDLVGFCEIDTKAERAYRILHQKSNNPLELMYKNLWDVKKMTSDILYDDIPNFDLMLFGFPCTDISRLGKQLGLIDRFPTAQEVFFGDLGNMTRSGLFFEAMRIAMKKKPKFMIAENVKDLVSSTFKDDFEKMLLLISDIGYKTYYKVLNTKDFGIPQSRPRVFMIMIRDDLDIEYEFPKPIPLTVKAADWFETEVDEEYYVKPEKWEKMNNYNNHKPQTKENDYIGCITTKWGSISNSGQKFIKVGDRYRIMTSEELMRFQGFPPEYGTLLRKFKFSKDQIGKLVGNSISVPVMEAIIKSLINCMHNKKKHNPQKSYTMPLFSYMGNKYRLMPRIDKYLPKEIDKMTFVDLFSGSAAVPINVSANKYILNDTDQNLIRIYKALATTKPDNAWAMVMDIVNEYDLSADNPDGYYQCRKDYIKFKKDNAIREKTLLKERGSLDEDTINEEKAAIKQNKEKECYWLLALIYHSFNTSTVQYNQKGEYNAPFGKFKCNIENAKNRFYPFANRIYRSGFSFEHRDFRKVIKSYINEENVFFYVDPPYICGTATYNKNWAEEDERDLYTLLEECDSAGVKWMLSNVLVNKKKENTILKEWLENAGKKYKVHYVQRDYSYNTYCRDNKGKTKEVIITNY